MTPRDVGLVMLPGGLTLAAAGFTTDHRSAAMLACGLVTPAAVATMVWCAWLTKRRPKLGIVAGLVGSLIRMTVAIGGGSGVYALTDWVKPAGLWFWTWLSVAYLSTLAAEVFVLAKPGWVGWRSGGSVQSHGITRDDR